MHTIGHSSMPSGAHHAAPALQTAAMASDAAAPAVEPMTCPGECAHAPAPARDGGIGGWSVCLAVLSALATLILLTVLVMRSGGHRHTGAAAVPWSRVPRGPPVRRAGLVLATVSVLRV